MEKMSFEEAMKNMENVVEKLEREELPLEDMIELYSEGMKLSKICGDKLQKAETTIEALMKDENGDFSVKTVEFKEDK